MFPLLLDLDRRYGGPDPRHEMWLTCTQRFFENLKSYCDADGVPVNLPDNHFVEWTAPDARPGYIGGKPPRESWEVAFYGAMLVLGLERAAFVANDLERYDLSRQWSDWASSLRSVLDTRYWSDKHGTYIDGIYDGCPSESISQTTNAMAALAQIGSSQRIQKALRTVSQTETSPYQ